jgi:hypothetical protein
VTLKMEAVRSCETSVNFNTLPDYTAPHHIRRCEILGTVFKCANGFRDKNNFCSKCFAPSLTHICSPQVEYHGHKCAVRNQSGVALDQAPHGKQRFLLEGGTGTGNASLEGGFCG